MASMYMFMTMQPSAIPDILDSQPVTCPQPIGANVQAPTMPLAGENATVQCPEGKYIEFIMTTSSSEDNFVYAKLNTIAPMFVVVNLL